MSPLRLIILAVALGAAVVAALLVRGMISQPAPQTLVETVEVAPTIATERVLVAKRDLALGERVAPEDLVWQDWPSEAVNPAFVVEATANTAIVDLAGAVVRADMLAGEPVTPKKLVLPGESGFMAAVLTPGMRAVAIEVSVETAAGGFILPNDRVDVVVTRSVDVVSQNQFQEGFKSDTILENVRILAVDQTYREVEGEQYVVGSTATLELKPEDAEILNLARRMGELSLVLRSVSDASLDLPSGATRKGTALRWQGADPTGEEAKPTVKVYRAGEMYEQVTGGAP